jgi:protein SCO1
MTTSLRMRAATAATVLGLAALAAGCGGDGDAASAGDAATATPTTATTAAAARPAPTPVDLTALEGDLAQPIEAAPPLRLRDARGRVADIRDAKGSPTFVTFVYTGCIDVCPLVLQNLSRARTTLKRDGVDLRVLAVSVDPEGDTPRVVRDFLADRGIAGDVRYLVGNRPRLESTWSAWGVGARVPKTDPHLVEHSALVYGVSASGKLTTRYPVDVRSQTVVRDARILARA